MHLDHLLTAKGDAGEPPERKLPLLSPICQIGE